MKSAINLLPVLLLLLLVSCSKDADDEQHLQATSCDQWVVVDRVLYDSAPDRFFTIKSADLEGDCLELLIESSGCSGDTWEVILVDSGAVAESNPPQRYLRLLFENEELCNAIVTKKISFDVSSIRRSDGGELILNIQKGGAVILD